MAADRRRWRYDACRTADARRPSAAPLSSNPRSSIGDTGRRRRLSRSSFPVRFRVCAKLLLAIVFVPPFSSPEPRPCDFLERYKSLTNRVIFNRRQIIGYSVLFALSPVVPPSFSVYSEFLGRFLY